MSVKIRLRRMGKKKQPHYRIVVTDSRFPRDGRFVENLGYYSPISEPARLRVDLERVDYWLGEGAIASPTVGSLVAKARVGGDGKVALEDAVAEPDAAAVDSADEPGAPDVAEPDAEAAEAGAEAAAEETVEDGEATDAPEPGAAGADAEAAAEETVEDGEATDVAEAEAEPETDEAQASDEDASE